MDTTGIPQPPAGGTPGPADAAPPGGPSAAPPAGPQHAGPQHAGTQHAGTQHAGPPGAGYLPPGAPGAGFPPGGSPGAPPPGSPPPPEAHRGSDSFFDSVRRMGVARSHERWIGGVAGGLARRFGVDPLVVRGAFVVLTLFGGLPLVLYGLAWALLPEEADGRIHLQEAIRGRFDAALAGAAAFVVLGVTRPVFWFDPDRWAPGWFVVVAWLGLLATVGVVALIIAGVTKRPAAHGAPPATPGYPGTPPTPYPAGAPSAAGPYSAGGTAVTTPVPGSTGPQPYPTPYPAPSSTPSSPVETAVGSPASPPQTGQTQTGQTQAYRPPAYPAQDHPTQAYPVATAYPPTAYRTPAPGYAPPAYTAPPPPAAPPAVLRPRVAGPGTAAVGIVLALCLFAGAAILLADRAGAFDGGAALTFAGVSLALLGLGVLVAGARGRRSGALGGIAILVAVLAVPAALVSNAALSWDRVVVSGERPAVGDASWTPTTVADAQNGLSLGAGTARVDLTAVPLDATSGPVAVPIDVGMGSTTVIVPSGVPVEIRTQVGAGQIRSVLFGDWDRSPSGARIETTQVPGTDPTPGAETPDTQAPDTEPVPGTEPPPGAELDVSRTTRTELQGTNLDLVLRSPETGDLALVVTIDVGLGDVTIEETLR